MKEQKNMIVVLTEEQSICDGLQAKLKGFVVAKAANVEAVNNSVKSGNSACAIVLHIKDSDGWMALDFAKTGYPSIPCFVMLEETEIEASKQPIMEKGAIAVFSKMDTASLARAIQSSARNNLRSGGDLDRNANFLRTFADISREIGRLHNEFTETALRTLPQPVVGDDTQKRLKDNLAKLQAIRITP